VSFGVPIMRRLHATSIWRRREIARRQRDNKGDMATWSKNGATISRDDVRRPQDGVECAGEEQWWSNGECSYRRYYLIESAPSFK